MEDWKDTLTTLIIADWKDIAGEIPTCVTALPSLRLLDLINNKLSIEILADVGKLSRLTVPKLANNALSGKIPASITRLGSLKHLDLNNNQLCGEIPKDFGNLAMLSCMLLSRNQLNGTPLRESYGEYVWLREGEKAGVRWGILIPLFWVRIWNAVKLVY